MHAVWYRFRAELRTSWRGIVAVALLAGAAGGVTLAAAASARRTNTAYPRLAAATKAADILVNPDQGTDSKLDADAVARLPQVKQIGRLDGLLIATSRLQTPADFAHLDSTLVAATTQGAYSQFNLPKVVDGRLPRLSHPNEALIDTTLARQRHLEVGDHLLATGFSLEQASVVFDRGPTAIAKGVREGTIGIKLEFRIVGIGVVPDNIVVDEGFNTSYMLLTPAFLERHPHVANPFYGLVVRLRGGSSSIPEFRAAVERLVPEEAFAFQTERVTRAKFARAVRPDVGALTIFAIVVAITGLLLVGQAIARQTFLMAFDAPTLRALGLGQGQLFVGAMVRAMVTAVGAAGIAVVLAFALSPLMPIGPARTAEPDPGLVFDGLVLGVGMLAVLLAVLALAVVPAWRQARARVDRSETARPSRLVTALSEAGASAPAVAGVRMALEPGRGRTAVPVRTTMMALALAVMVVVGAAGVAASIDHLVDTPRLFGWNWDIQVAASRDAQSGASKRIHKKVDRLLNRSHVVHAWSTLSLSDVRLETGSVPAVGIDPRRRNVVPTLISGRLPSRGDEIALGVRTLNALDAHIGSVVHARANDNSRRALHVVGRVVLPGVGTYPGSDKTALGEGAVVTQRSLRALGPDFSRNDYLIDFTSSASPRAQKRLTGKIGDIVGPGDDATFEVGSVRRPSDINSYERVRKTPIILGGVLALLALASVVHALITAVRRRRLELALLQTLGFTRRQVSKTVTWQATTVAFVAIVLGIPLGIALGRIGWNLLASNLGTVSEPVVPVLVVAAIGVAAFALMNLAALVPGRRAARLRPAAVLRSE